MHEAMTPEVKTALDECREIIRKGSKVFPGRAALRSGDADAAFFLTAESLLRRSGRSGGPDGKRGRAGQRQKRWADARRPRLPRPQRARFLSPCSTSRTATAFRRTMRWN